MKHKLYICDVCDAEQKVNQSQNSSRFYVVSIPIRNCSYSWSNDFDICSSCYGDRTETGWLKTLWRRVNPKPEQTQPQGGSGG